MENFIIKVCGMREPDNIRDVAALGVDWIGMIFWPGSPRCVAAPPDCPPGGPARVGVFVDATADDIAAHVADYGLSLVQLHGQEPPAFVAGLRRVLGPSVGVVKAVSVSSRADVAVCRQYEPYVDYFLFDTRCPTVGGSGRQFDWSVLAAYEGARPFLLSGGIGPDDAARVARFSHPRCAGIDVNSRFETAPARKDVAALERFLKSLSPKNPSTPSTL